MQAYLCVCVHVCVHEDLAHMIMVFSPHVVLPVGGEAPSMCRQAELGREYQHDDGNVLNTRVRRMDPNTRKCTPSLKSDSEAQAL